MEGNKIFPDDILRDKVRPPRVYCRYKVWILHLMGRRGYAWYEKEKYVPFDYIHIVCTQKCCHEKYDGVFH